MHRVVFHREVSTSGSGAHKVPLAVIHIASSHTREEIESLAIREFERNNGGRSWHEIALGTKSWMHSEREVRWSSGLPLLNLGQARSATLAPGTSAGASLELSKQAIERLGGHAKRSRVEWSFLPVRTGRKLALGVQRLGQILWQIGIHFNASRKRRMDDRLGLGA